MGWPCCLFEPSVLHRGGATLSLTASVDGLVGLVELVSIFECRREAHNDPTQRDGRINPQAFLERR